MTTTHFQLDDSFSANSLVDWFNLANIGDAAVIALPPESYTVQLLRSDQRHVHWWPYGERGVTVRLKDAILRLQMLHALASSQRHPIRYEA